MQAPAPKGRHKPACARLALPCEGIAGPRTRLGWCVSVGVAELA